MSVAKRRIVEFMSNLRNDGLSKTEILSGMQNGDIEQPEWLATGTTGLGWCAWDTAESSGDIKLYCLEEDDE
jgi:hypothetical protein